MANIPSTLNGVQIEFDSQANNDVLDLLIEGLSHTIKPNVSGAYPLTKIWISSLRDRHVCPSRHVSGNAVDISRINGKRISTYAMDAEVKAIADALQDSFELFLPGRRENFGPKTTLKLGSPISGVGDHSDHIHYSVSGPHSCATPKLVSFLRRIFTIGSKHAEICDQ